MTTTNKAFDRVPAVISPRIPFDFARTHQLLFTRESESDTCLATASTEPEAIDNLSLFLKLPLSPTIAPENEVVAAINAVYQEQMSGGHAVAHAVGISDAGVDQDRPNLHQELARLNDRDLLSSGLKEPVARLVDALLFDALERRASDLHVHPLPPTSGSTAVVPMIRYRIDGVLHDAHSPPAHLYEQIVGRIKVLAGMDVAEKRLPQDGRSSVSIGSRQIDLRVSTLPTVYGERVVVRLLEQTAGFRELPELGMPPHVESALRDAILRTYGLILVTGPTGSGKTTTIYSLLAQLDAKEKNILTLEDPVEYKLPGISQTQISDKKGMGFLNGLRHVLRQDPDVILIGETRDEPTARMVVQSSLTGHLVLTTLHTNSAAGAIARLADLGIEPYLITSSLIGVLAQRLIRKCCPLCPGSSARSDCPRCSGTGYAGRFGLYEWLPATATVKQHILRDQGAESLEHLAAKEGMSTLLQQGLALAKQGLTAQEEVLRVLGSVEN